MSGETEDQVSGFTVDTLHHTMTARFAQLDMLLNERDRRYQERHEAAQGALALALESLNKRLDALNELREGVATSGELDAVALRLADMKERQDKLAGSSAGVRMSAGFVAALVAGIAAVVVIVNIAIALAAP